MRDNRSRHSLPSEHMVRDILGDDRVPPHGYASRAGHRPSRTPVTDVPHLAHMLHELGEVFEVLPETKDLTRGRVDVNRLLKIDASSAITQAENPIHLEVGYAAQEQAEPRGAEENRGQCTTGQAIHH